MKNTVFIGLLMAAFATALVQCEGSVATESGADPRLAPVQPNVTSALAQSMRDLDAELLDIRQRLMEGEDLAGARFTEYHFMEMEPTDSTMLVEGFQALSIAFERQVAEFNAAPDAEKYAAVVGGCEACHMRSCPGPLERIAKRHLSHGE